MLEQLQSNREVASAWGAMLWLGTELARPQLPACPTGFAELDAELPGGGWPAAGLSELLLSEAGHGEIQLLAPGLRHRASPPAHAAPGPRELLWIDPPHPPYAPALQSLGLPLDRFTWVQPAVEADGAWVAEQALRAGSCAVVLWWSRSATPDVLRRLHLAAQEGGTPLFALRPWACRQQSSPAPLRLECRLARRCELSVQIIKRRGPPMAVPLNLRLAEPGALKPIRNSAPLQSRNTAFTEVPDAVAGPVSAAAAA